MRPRAKRWLDAGCVLTVLVVYAIVAALTWVARERELATARAELGNLTAALELYVGSTVNAIDQGLIGARRTLRLIGATGEVSFEAGSKVLADAAAQLAHPVSMHVIGADGLAVFSADGRVTGANASDREYFRVHQQRTQRDDLGLYVSELLTSRVNGLESLVFSRRLDDARGRFAGVIVVTAPVSVFERDFARLGTGRAGAVALGDDAGRLYARRPARPELVGKKVARDDGPALTLLRQGTPRGLVTVKSSLDGVASLVGFQRVGSTRLVVTVSSSFDEQLASWRLQALVVAVTALLLGGVSVLSFTLLTRDLVRKTQLTEELRHAVAALQQSVQAEQDANSAKTAFLSSMSHELMTPLNGIYGAVQLWQLGEKDEGRKRLASVARSSTERLNTALRDALAYANATSSAVEGALAPFDLRGLLAELPDLFAAQPGSDACRLDVAPPPEAGPALTVRTDPAAVRDALGRMLNVAVRVARRVAAAPAVEEAAAAGNGADAAVGMAGAGNAAGTAGSATGAGNAGGSGAALGARDAGGFGAAVGAGDAGGLGAAVALRAASPAAPLPRLAQPGTVHVAVEPALPPGSLRLRVDTAIEPGSDDSLEAALRPFADSGATESSGLHDAGLSLEVARLLAVRAGAALHVECRGGRLEMALALGA